VMTWDTILLGIMAAGAFALIILVMMRGVT